MLIKYGNEHIFELYERNSNIFVLDTSETTALKVGFHVDHFLGKQEACSAYDAVIQHFSEIKHPVKIKEVIPLQPYGLSFIIFYF